MPPTPISCISRGMDNCRPIHKQMLSMVCIWAVQEGPHRVLLLNPEPSAEALDGWEGMVEGQGMGSVEPRKEGVPRCLHTNALTVYL